MSGESKAQLINDGKALLVSCDNAEFARIMQAICDSIGYTEQVTEVVDVRVTNSSQWKQSAPFSRLRDRIALGGCAIIAFLLAFVFLSGITKIIEMFSE
jgi:hypothetical protein